MNEFEKLDKEIENIKNKKRKLEEQIEKYNLDIREKQNQQADYYRDFFKNDNKEFILYDEFPGLEELKLYTKKYGWHFPISGTLNAKEVAELIKQFYQYERQKEYNILTIGVNQLDNSKEHGMIFSKIIPHIYFLIGTNKTLEPFYVFNGCYINDEEKQKIWYKLHYASDKDLISISLIEDYYDNSLDISCMTNSVDKKGRINYYDYLTSEYDSCSFGKNIDIFSKLNHITYNSTGVKDLISFDIAEADSFIANLLISICIYKNNNQIKELTTDDYNHIFDVLYREKVDIIGNMQKDIPKNLKYIPSKKEEVSYF